MIAVIAIALVVLAHVDWNPAKPWVNAHVSKALGRPFWIAGNLSLNWEEAGSKIHEEKWRGLVPWPHFIAQDVHIGNPASLATAANAHMSVPLPAEFAHVRQFTFSANPFALLDRKIVIPLLQFDSPGIDLQRKADGSNTWTFQPEDDKSPWKLELNRVDFSKGQVHLADALKHMDVRLDVDNLNADAVYGVAWKLHGKFEGETIDGDGKAGTILSLRSQTLPYPILAHLRGGHTEIALEGTLTRPSDLAALDMHLKVSSASMADLYRFFGIVLPETPHFATEGHLIGSLGARGQHWIYRDFSGIVGHSDIGGSFDYRTRQPRPLLSGTIVSHLTQFSDFAPLIGADSNKSKVERGAAVLQPSNKLLPIEPFRENRWTSIDTDITFSSEKIMWQKELPIQKLMTRLHLQDGVLSMAPLNFEVAGGSVRSDISLDGSGRAAPNAIKADLKANVRRLNVKKLFPSLQPMPASVGEVDGDVSLQAAGNSVAGLLGASNGEVKTLINQGTISKLLLEKMGMNIGNVVMTQLVGDKQVDLQCTAADFDVKDGVMQTRSFIVDTSDALINVDGQVNLAQEQLNLTLRSPTAGGYAYFHS